MQAENFTSDRLILQRLSAQGFRPTVVFGIGSSMASWAGAVQVIVPDAEYHLFEAFSETAPALAGGFQPGDLLRFPDLRFHPVTVVAPHFRLDDYRRTYRLPAPDLIKIDCLGAEGVILRGATGIVDSSKVLLVRTRLRTGRPDESWLADIIEFLERRSFVLADFGERLYDEHHRLSAVDAVFLAGSCLEGFSLSPTDYVRELTGKLMVLTAGGSRQSSPGSERKTWDPNGVVLHNADVIITPYEVNDRHGTGVLLRKMFRGWPNILSLRSENHYDGRQEFGDLALRVSHIKDRSPNVVAKRIRQAFKKSTAGRVLCIPYLADDARSALAIQETFSAPMCTYLMDDQNVCVEGIPDDLMRELLENSALRLAISPELRIAYQQKYGCPIWYMPPVAPGYLIAAELQVPQTAPYEKHGVLIGNIWSPGWVNLLRRTVKNSGVKLSWYFNGDLHDIPCGKEHLASGGIFLHEPVPEQELVKILREMWFAVVPSGTLEGDDDRQSIARLSLPSRVVYLMATSHIPILVLGSAETPAARFVEQFGIGMVASYRRGAFVDAVNQIMQRDLNLEMRKRARALSSRFTDAGAAEWIWQSLERGEPVDRRYEELMPEDPALLSRVWAGGRNQRPAR